MGITKIAADSPLSINDFLALCRFLTYFVTAAFVIGVVLLLIWLSKLAGVLR